MDLSKGAHGVLRNVFFLVLSGNPLDDIRQTRRLEAVYFDGRELNRAGLRTRLSGAP